MYWSHRAANTGPSLPRVSWRNKHDKDSKIHYEGSSGKTLCGKRIPRSGVGEDDAVDMCERCLKIAEKKG